MTLAPPVSSLPSGHARTAPQRWSVPTASTHHIETPIGALVCASILGLRAKVTYRHGCAPLGQRDVKRRYFALAKLVHPDTSSASSATNQNAEQKLHECFQLVAASRRALVEYGEAKWGW